MTEQQTRTIWVYGPDNTEKGTYISKKLSALGYQFFEVLWLSSDDFRELAAIDNKKKVLVIENVRDDWPDEELVSAWVRGRELYSVRKSFYDYRFELIVFHSLHSPHQIYLRSLALRKRIYEGEVLRLEENKTLRIELDKMLTKGEITPSEFFTRIQPIVHRETS